MNKLIQGTMMAALLMVGVQKASAQGMAVNTTGAAAAASAALDVTSTTQGVLVPRMISSQRTGISSPATGLLVYQTDATAGFYYYNGSAWTSLSGGAPTGSAGGDLGGTYPNPSIANNATSGNHIATALGSASSGTTGSGNVVLASSPTLISPALGTPSALVGTNISGTAASLTAGNVTTNANLTGEVTSVGNTATINTTAAAGNHIATALGSASAGTTGSGNVVLASSPTLVTPSLGTPSALVGTNISGTASILTAGHVTTNANLTGEVTSVGNTATINTTAAAGNHIATALGSASAGTTGSGNVVLASSPTLVTPALGTPSALVGTNISGTASNLTAGDVGTSATAGNHMVTALGAATTGTIPAARLGTSSGSASTYLNGTGTFSTPSGGGGGTTTYVVATISASTTSTTIATNSSALLNYDNIITNVGSGFNGTTFTAPSAGNYLVTASFGATNAGHVNQMYLSVGGSIVEWGGAGSAATTFPADLVSAAITTVLTLSTGNTVSAGVASANNSSTTQTNGTARLTITKLN
jgi:hypothetical protein